MSCADGLALPSYPGAPPEFFRPALLARVVQSIEDVHIGDNNLRLFEQEHGRVRTLGFRIGPFAYSTDVHDFDGRARSILEGVDTWLVDAFQRQPHSSHAHLSKVITWASELRVRRTVLTHMGTDLDWGRLIRSLPPGVEPAFDGMELRF